MNYLIHHTRANSQGEHSGIETLRAVAATQREAFRIARQQRDLGGGYVVIEHCDDHGEALDPAKIVAKMRGAQTA
jgi:hypothetical protein